MNFKERFKGKMSSINKQGVIGDVELLSRPINLVKKSNSELIKHKPPLTYNQTPRCIIFYLQVLCSY